MLEYQNLLHKHAMRVAFQWRQLRERLYAHHGIPPILTFGNLGGQAFVSLEQRLCWGLVEQPRHWPLASRPC